MKKTLVFALAVGGMLASLTDLRAELIYGVTNTAILFSVDSAIPLSFTAIAVITGLQSGESILAIDVRPATGQIYALGSASRLYVINSVTGVATQVGSAGAFTLSGTSFGFDFNPVVDRIRVVSDADQNIRLNPNDGTLSGTDTNLAYAAGDPNAGANANDVAAAYTNNLAGASSTTLFGIDSNLDIVARQGSPDGTPVSPTTGQLFTIGSLGVNGSAAVGFDISGATGVAYASLCPGVSTPNCGLYTINLTTGAATLVAQLLTETTINDITVSGQGGATPTPTPTGSTTPTPTTTLTPVGVATSTPTATVTATPTATTTLAGGGPTTPVPTLSGWAVAALFVLLATVGFFVTRNASG
jgi:hypothetical protein